MSAIGAAGGKTAKDDRSGRLPLLLLALVLVATVVSYIGAADRLTWWLEALPVVIAVPVMVLTWRSYPLSGLLYLIVFLHCLILLAGAHWTYAEVPLGEWAKGWFGWERNNYDKLGHLAQGVTPVLLAREILLRWSPFRLEPRNRWLPVLCVAAPGAFSAIYEIIEWLTAVALGGASAAFLGSQGDVWDAQSDMLMAFVGAIAALVLLSRLHDASLRRLGWRPGPA
jgi:putative membrane protein